MKNLKSTIMNSLNIVFAILMYIFMSQSYLDSFLVSVSGYDTLGDAKFFEGDSTEIMIALSNLLILILISLIVLISIYSLLCNFGVIKKSTKLANFLNIILGIATFVFAMISLFCMVGYINQNEITKNTLDIGWAIIVNMVVALFLLVSTILASKFSSNSKGKRKK